MRHQELSSLSLRAKVAGFLDPSFPSAVAGQSFFFKEKMFSLMVRMAVEPRIASGGFRGLWQA